MPDETNIQRITDYVRQYRDQYGLEELRRQLLAAGYPADDIAAAFAQLDSTAVPLPPVADATEGEIEQMLAYLRQHRDHYSIEALRSQLLAAGRPLPQVETALARLQAEQQPPRRPKRWLLVIALALLNTILLPVLSYLLALATGDIGNTFVISGALLLVELVSGVALLFRPRTVWLGQSLLISVVISLVLLMVLAIIGVIILAGTCLVMLRNL